MGDTNNMRKEYITREDGRYLIFYYFNSDPKPASTEDRKVSHSKEEKSDV